MVTGKGFSEGQGVAREKGGEGQPAGLPFHSAEVAAGPGSAMPGVCGFGGKALTLIVEVHAAFCGKLFL